MLDDAQVTGDAHRAAAAGIHDRMPQGIASRLALSSHVGHAASVVCGP
jgi:hypothetical protein